jgi:hypothetical protein
VWNVDNVEREKQMRAGQTGPNSGARAKHLVPVSRVRAANEGKQGDCQAIALVRALTKSLIQKNA